MYLRHTTVRKDGKTHTYWRLVRSVRRDGKVVQETVAQLGELDAEGRLSARRLARAMTGRGDQPDLFEQGRREPWTVPVRLDQVRVERGRRFGDVTDAVATVSVTGQVRWVTPVGNRSQFGLSIRKE